MCRTVSAERSTRSTRSNPEAAKRADQIALDANLCAADPHAIEGVKVCLEMVGSEIVYERGVCDWITDRYLGLRGPGSTRGR